MDQFTAPMQNDPLVVAIATNMDLDPANPNVKVAAQQLREAHPGQTDDQLVNVVKLAAKPALNMAREARPQDFETYNKGATPEDTPASPVPEQPAPQVVEVTGKKMSPREMARADMAQVKEEPQAPAEESDWKKLYKQYAEKFGAEGQKKVEDEHNSRQIWTDIVNSRAGSVNIGAGGIYAMDALKAINENTKDRTARTRDQTLGAFDRAKAAEKEALDFGTRAAEQERADKRLAMEAERMGMDKKEFNLRMTKAENELTDYYEAKAVIARMKDPSSPESTQAREAAAAAFEQAGMPKQAEAVRKSGQSAEQLSRALPAGVKENIAAALEQRKFEAEQLHKEKTLGLQGAQLGETRRHNIAIEGIQRDTKEAAKAPKPMSVTDAKTLAETKGTIASIDKSIKSIEEAKKLIDGANYGFGTGPVKGRVARFLEADTFDSNNARLQELTKELVLAASGGKLGAGISNSDVAFLESASGVLNSPQARKKLEDLLAKVQAERQAHVELINNYSGRGNVAPIEQTVPQVIAVPAEGGVFTKRGAPGSK